MSDVSNTARIPEGTALSTMLFTAPGRAADGAVATETTVLEEETIDHPEDAGVGYEAAEMTARRLRLRATEDVRLQEALRSLAPAWDPNAALDSLARDVLVAPGAAGELLTSFAAQSRALRLVWEVVQRGAGELPADVWSVVENAVSKMPKPLRTAVDVRRPPSVDGVGRELRLPA